MNKILVANWKMNGTRQSIKHFLDLAVSEINDISKSVEVVFCPPFPYLYEYTHHDRIKLGAQNIAIDDFGAFTGEVSGVMLKDCHVNYAIIGHSERRKIFLETNEIVATKFLQCFKSKITPIVCVGETIEERKNNLTQDVIQKQLSAVFDQRKTPAEPHEQVIIAYEPVWSIGSGNVANIEEIESVANNLKDFITKNYLGWVNNIKVLYGGSLKAANATQILNHPSVDGGLVGAASLQWSQFKQICQAII